MNISEMPEEWIIVKTPHGYKVFGTWRGGYLYGDRWKMNSGIIRVEQDFDYYYFFGFSGSCYKCHKQKYGVATFYTQGVLDNIIEKSNGTIKILKNKKDWGKLKTKTL